MTRAIRSAMIAFMRDHSPGKAEDAIASTEDWRPLPARLGDLPAFTLSRRRTDRWSLVLEARALPFRIERRGFGWQLLVPAGRFEAALNELRQFEAENRHWPPPLPQTAPPTGNPLAVASVLLLLATFHNLTLLETSLFSHRAVDWIALGNAHAGRILDGEWWRPVTALTLHADWRHLLSNLAAGGIFAGRLARDLGSGLTWSLLLGAGALGNLANAVLQHPGHRAVGASTAVFGAVGLLAAINLLRYRRPLQRRWLLPVAGALALLAFLGTEGERTDLGAHLFGFAAGILLGLATEYLLNKHGRPGRKLNILLALASAGAVLAAWGAALASSG